MYLRFLEMMSNKVGFISCIVIILSNLGIYESFIIFLKSFIFKKIEIELYKNYCLSERCAYIQIYRRIDGRQTKCN